MLKRMPVVLVCAAMGCAGGGGGKLNYDQRQQLMIASQKAPLDEAELEGVWNDASDSAIAIMHREGDEIRMLLAIGDTRPNIPLTTFEATNMGNPLPGPEARERAKEALKGWRTGVTVPRDRFLFAAAGKNNGAGGVVGSWTDANGDCSSPMWGNFYFQVNRDKNGAPVVYMSVYASKKKIIGGTGGQSFDFGRWIYFGKAVNPAPPSILENMQKTDNFCRRTAE